MPNDVIPDALLTFHQARDLQKQTEKKINGTMSLFAEATKKAASARFKQPQLDSEGQEIEVSSFYCALYVRLTTCSECAPPTTTLIASHRALHNTIHCYLVPL